MASAAVQLTAPPMAQPSTMLPSAMAWLRAAADRLQHLFALDRQPAMLRALDVLDWVEENCAPFGADGFDWSPDSAVEAVNEFLKDGD
jgi:hypothetical protein